MKKFLYAFFLFLPAAVWAGELYVSPGGNDSASGTANAPCATFERARERVRLELANSAVKEPWTVRFAEGEYPLTRPLTFTPEDSGTPDAPVTYRGADNGKTVFTGSLKLSNWKDEGNGVWSAELPEYEGSTLYFEQMWVNGRRAVRSRYPNEGFLRMESVREEVPMDQKTRKSEKPQTLQWVTGKPGELDFLKDVPVNELKWSQMIVHHNWDTTRRIILGFDAETNTIEAKGGNMKSWNPWRPASLYYFENLRSAFDQPGEWFYDGNAKKVFYRPMEGETIQNTRFDVPRPGLTQFLVIQGTSPNETVSDLRFENLSFHFSDTPRQKNVMANAQIDVSITGDLDKPGPSQFEPAQAAFYTKSVVLADEALRIAFKNCEIAHIGEYGIWFRNAAECSFRDSKLFDIGAGGIRIGGGHPGTAEGIRCAEKNVIDNNIISGGGRFHASAVGVWIGNNTMDNQLTHNDIFDFYYTGVSVGWNWGYAGVSFRNIIEFNRIHDIGQGVLADMGGVYTLGTQTGTRVCNNVIFNVESFGYGGWGLYPDEGTTGITMENNLVYDTMDGSFHQHYGKDNLVRNNIFARNKPNPMRNAPAHQVAVTRVEDHRSVIFENNIIYWKDGTSIGYNVEKVKADIRSNLWWKDGGEVDFKGKTHDQWTAEGKDVGGLVADPLFVNPEANDFHLKPGSPAEKIGFKPFDYEKAGLRKPL